MLNLLSACGFHLQGQNPTGDSHTVSAAKLSFATSASLIEPAVLAAAGRYNIRHDENSATAITISTVRLSERNLSLAAKNQTIQRQLQARVNVNYNNGQSYNDVFTRTAIYSHDPLAVSASERERQLQQQQLLRQLAEQIIMRFRQMPATQ